MMTKTFLMMMCTSVLFAGYTYEIGPGEFDVGLSLDDSESLLMTGGWIGDLDLLDWSTARIEGTDPLISEAEGGGIWMLRQGGYSRLEILGGDIHEIEFGPSTRGTGNLKVSGGRIDILRNWQDIGPDKNIEFVCRDWEYDIDTNKLTGTWEDFSTFDIQLRDVTGYEATIDNIKFTIVPEPVTFLLVGFGVCLIRRQTVTS